MGHDLPAVTADGCGYLVAVADALFTLKQKSQFQH
jgi:hypothetical protein